MGLAVMPYIASDIEKWPITIDELAPHYTAVLNSMQLSAATDNLAELFPIYTDQPDRFGQPASTGFPCRHEPS